MDDQNKNLLLATALSFVVILTWFLLFPPPEPPAEDPNAIPTSEIDEATGAPVASAPDATPDTAAPTETDRRPRPSTRRASRSIPRGWKAPSR